MTTFTTHDGTRIFYKDWGPRDGQPIVFSHGWPLTADAWDSQMVFFANQGFRTIAHDRRSHGRSDQVWNNNTMDQYADDLGELIDHLGLQNAILVGHSTGWLWRSRPSWAAMARTGSRNSGSSALSRP